MAEKVVNLSWRILIMGLIGAGCLVASALLYRGILAVLAAEFPHGATAIVAGILTALAVWWLCVHRNDLICVQPAR